MNTRSLALPRRRRSSSGVLSGLGSPVSRRRKLRVEPLETRLLLATNYLVNSLDDVVGSDGVITLREALEAANTDSPVHDAPAGTGHDVIEFDAGLTGGTIELSAALAELQITDNLELIGLGPVDLTIDAAGNSGVFFVDDAVTDATISGLTITGGSGVGGGGIRNLGTLSVVDSTISGNSANAGGGIFSYFGTLSVVDSTISGNSATRDGAGIYNYDDLSVVNSTISDNSATGDGGGIFNDYKLLAVNSTISDNSTAGAGGGVYTSTFADHTTLNNTIVAGNRHGTAPDDLSGNVATGDSYNNLIGDLATSGGLVDGVNGNIVDVPDLSWLAPLGDFGGPTHTHALLPGSPAIDTGDDTRAVDPDDGPLTADQRGLARFLDGDGSGTPSVDIGAFEFDPSLWPLVVSTLADELDGDHLSGDLSLREALALAALNPGRDEIQFDPALAGETITLDAALGELQITSDLDLIGLGAADLTIDAAGNGRVFYVDSAVTDATIDGVTIAGGSAHFGGGISNDGTLSVVNSTISGNSALAEGGGIRNGGTLSVISSTISGNSADWGGGIENWGTLSVVNSTISGNSADRGGGIENLGTLSAVSSTISDNSANYGGGIGDFRDATLHNTIVAGNVANADGPDVYGTVVDTSSYNLIGNGTGMSGIADGVNGNLVGTAVSPIDPRLALLGDYGGPTQTHALSPDSPAIDAGDPSFDPGAFDPPLDTDQRGFARVVDGDGDAVAIIDVGAVEREVPPATVAARWVFYNHSAFDDDDPAANVLDDDAIAPDKQALLPGQSAGFENYTSYAKGINGLMVDIAGLTGTPTAADFGLKMGNDDTPDDWATVPDPSVTVRPGEGDGGSDRVTLVWPDYDTVNPDPTTQAVAKQWLQVTVRSTLATGLAEPDVFYFGNAVGESGLGNFGGAALVNAVDSGAVRDNPHNPFVEPAPLDDFADYNRDQWVNAVDFGLVRDNATNPMTALKLITAPSSGPAPGPEGAPAAARIDRGALHDAALGELSTQPEDDAQADVHVPDLSWLDGSDGSGAAGRSSRMPDPTRAAVEMLLATLT